MEAAYLVPNRYLKENDSWKSLRYLQQPLQRPLFWTQGALMVFPIDRLTVPLRFLSRMEMESLVHRTSKRVIWSVMQQNCKEHPGNYPSGFAKQIDVPEVEVEAAVTVVTPDHQNTPWRVAEGD